MSSIGNVAPAADSLTLEAGLSSIKQRLECLDDTIRDRPTFVAICGGSSTGKSTFVSNKIEAHLCGEATVLMQDMFMRIMDREKMNPRYRGDDPLNFGLEEIGASFRKAQKWESFEWPIFDFLRRAPTPPRVIAPSKWVILDGMYAAYGDLRKFADCVIYVEAKAAVRAVRRIFRNRYERYPGLCAIASGTIASFFQGVSNAHTDFVSKQRADADIVIRSDAPFQTLIDRFSIPEAENVIPSEPLKLFELDSESTITLEQTRDQRMVFRIASQGTTYLFQFLDLETAEKIMDWDAGAY